MYRAFATDGVWAQEHLFATLDAAIEAGLKAFEAYGAEVWVETMDGRLIWRTDESELPPRRPILRLILKRHQERG